MQNVRRTGWVLAMLALAANACDESGTTNGSDDGGPKDTSVDGDAPHTLNSLEVKGTVTLRYDIGASDVKVVARCGSKSVDTNTDNDGEYSFVADVKGCSPLVVEYTKESYLPNIRVIHLPPPASPLTVDVPLTELKKLSCGEYYCNTGSGNPHEMEADPVQQGWTVTVAGKDGLDYFPGEFRDLDGKLIGFVGFSFYDLRTVDGTKIEKLEPAQNICVRVPREARHWLGDVDPSTDEVEMGWYSLDLRTGRWISYGELSVVKVVQGDQYTITTEGVCEYLLLPDGFPAPNFQPIRRSDLPDIRAETFTYYDECVDDDVRVYDPWVCGWVHGSGWYAWGVRMQERSCYSLEATDQCGDPVPNVVFQLKGRFHGYRAEAWTDRSGKACLEVIPSEPEGEDFDVDGLGGETFMVDVSADSEYSSAKVESKENQTYDPNNERSCSAPDSCIELKKTFQDYRKESCSPE